MTCLQWVCFEVFRRRNSIFHLTTAFTISEKNAHDQFEQTICGRAGVEPATPGSAV